MSLQMRDSSNWWYGQFTIDGRRVLENLGVKIEGRRPKSINRTGDVAFEKSRQRAQVIHDQRYRQVVDDRHGLRAAEKILQIRRRRHGFAKIAELADKWEAIPRSRAPSVRYVDQCRAILNRFSRFMEAFHPKVTEFIGVQEDIAIEFMEGEAARGISPKAYNDILKLLRSTFRNLHPDIPDGQNAFARIPTKPTETIYRRPFTPEELKKLYSTVKDDDFMRPIVVCGMSTAMRLGDCCKLKWADVDLKEDFITVKTSKTGSTAEIPIAPLLRGELEQLERSGEYCFPEQAAMYRHNPSGFGYRFKKLLIKAGFAEPSPSKQVAHRPEPELPVDEVRERVDAAIAQMVAPLNRPDKPAAMKQVAELYLDGQSFPDIAGETGLSRGTVSNYLNELEDAVGFRIVRRPSVGVRSATGELKNERPSGVRRASKLDFHSLRVTWITLALTAGMPIELVRLITGHRTVETVLKHYYKPRRENLRQAFQRSMPELLTSGPRTREEQLRGVLELATEEDAWDAVQKAKLLLPPQESAATI